jgi:DNA-binding GntR family transcriptional regulator
VRAALLPQHGHLALWRRAPVPALSGIQGIRGARRSWSAFEYSLLERFPAQKVLTTGTIGDLQDAIEQQAQFDEPGHAKEFLEFDHCFHRVLIEAAGNAMLATARATLRAQRMGWAHALAHSADRQAAVPVEHQTIVNALASQRSGCDHRGDQPTPREPLDLQLLTAT